MTQSEVPDIWWFSARTLHHVVPSSLTTLLPEHLPRTSWCRGQGCRTSARRSRARWLPLIWPSCFRCRCSRHACRQPGCELASTIDQLCLVTTTELNEDKSTCIYYFPTASGHRHSKFPILENRHGLFTICT